MNLRETFRVALRAIRRNKVRSALTMLGVIIGVASVIAMIALGSGARASIDEQIQSQGTTRRPLKPNSVTHRRSSRTAVIGRSRSAHARPANRSG